MLPLYRNGCSVITYYGVKAMISIIYNIIVISRVHGLHAIIGVRPKISA